MADATCENLDDWRTDPARVRAAMVDLQREVLDWQAERTELADAETSGDYPDADAWHNSDDSGIEILGRLADVIDAHLNLTKEA